MDKYSIEEVQGLIEEEVEDSIEHLLRQGARRMLQAALEMEIAAYVDAARMERDDQGRRAVVRNGYLPERKLWTGVGPVPVRQPRVRDRREGHRFTSAILPRYMRRTPSLDALIPALYLKGLSTNAFPEALEAILGEGAAGLSSANIVRLKEIWQEEYQTWRKRDLTDKHYVYLWVDGIYFNVRLGSDRPCVLVVIGATEKGQKELIAIEDGERESKLSWKEVLLEMKARGLRQAPSLAVGDGALGFWAALEEVFPACRHQRCWVHKSANVLDKMPKKQQRPAKQLLRQMYTADTREEALQHFDRFLELYEARYPKACAALRRDKDTLFTFYSFPAEHWQHLRTTNPIESTFGTLRHRTRQTKGCGSRQATLMMVYKLAIEAEKRWRGLRQAHVLQQVIQGIPFVNGQARKAAWPKGTIVDTLRAHTQDLTISLLPGPGLPS